MEMTELEKAKADLDYYRHVGGFGYKQAKRHYERVLRKERRNAERQLPARPVLGEQADL
jgi:hypothetical protein